VRRLMRQESLSATTKRRRYGSYQGEIGPAPENVINREFLFTNLNWSVRPATTWNDHHSMRELGRIKVIQAVIDGFQVGTIAGSAVLPHDKDIRSTVLRTVNDKVIMKSPKLWSCA
jgi:hypothetical protein